MEATFVERCAKTVYFYLKFSKYKCKCIICKSYKCLRDHRPDKIIFNILLSYLNCMCNECKKIFDWLFWGQHFQILQRYKNTRRPHNIYNESPLHYMFYNYVYLYPSTLWLSTNVTDRKMIHSPLTLP